MSSNKVKTEGMLPLEEAADHLEALAASLRQGCARVGLGAETLVLEPPSVVNFELKASQKKEKEKIKLELSWSRQDAAGGEVVIAPAEAGLKIG